MISLYNRFIDEILEGADSPAQSAIILLDRYDCANARDEFVMALVHRLLVERARNQAASKLRSTNSSTVHNRSITRPAIARVQLKA
jgi:hypothetical protein